MKGKTKGGEEGRRGEGKEGRCKKEEGRRGEEEGKRGREEEEEERGDKRGYKQMVFQIMLTS